VKRLSVFAFALFMTCAAAWAQGTAQIHGTVQDSTGAAIPAADVKATQTDTGVSRSTMTGADGGYVLTNLPLGPYRIDVTKQGFTTAVQSGIVLQVGNDLAVNIAMQVGAVTEEVNVQANAALVETRNLGVGEVVQTQRIVDLPLNGRNVTDLIGLGGASVQTGNNQTRWFSGLPVISIGGSAAAGGSGGTQLLATEYMLDGANHLNFLSGTTMPIAFPDAVQEFKAETTGQTAQRGASTSVSIVTRSGTNEFHGDLFEFLRNDGFGSAREYFSPVASTYKRNQFGGTVGGPIKKDKLFFFGGYQGTTVRQTLPNTSVVPTQAVMNGDWTTFASATCQGAPRSLRGGTVNNLPNANAAFAGNRINPAFYTPQALYIANAYLNNLGGLQPDQCGHVTYQVPTHENDNQYVAKVDYQLSDKQSIFIRSLDSHIFYPPALTGCTFDLASEALSGNCLSNNMLNSTQSGEDQLAHSYAIGDTYLLSANMVNAFRVAFNRTAATLNSPDLFTLCDAGVNMYCGGTPGQLGGATIVGGFGFGTGLGNGDFWNGQSFSVNDDVSYIRGAHQMGFGFGWWQGRVDEFNHFTPAGANILFTGQATSLGMSDFLLGDVSSFLQGLPNAYSSRQNSFDFYFTDTWKINSHLTFNFGIRWEPFLPLQTTNGQISNFSLDRFLAGTQSNQFANAPPGFYFPGDPGFPGQSSAYHKWAHFDPRGGIVWDPKGDGKTSIRAAYAFGYAYVPGIAHEDEGGSNPWGGRVTLTSPAGGLASPWQAQPGGNPYPYAVTPDVKFTPGGQFMTTPYDLQSPTTYSYNVSVQRQIGSSWVATVTYIGSRVQHLYINQAINYAAPVAGPFVASGCLPTALNCNALANEQVRRVLSQASTNYATQGALIGNMDTWYPYGTQLYNGLLSSLQKRLSRGVTLSANWTWSHCIGYFQGFNSKPEETATNPYNPLGDRGNCDSDRRHLVNFTAVAQTPSFSNHLMNTVVSGWQLSGIYRFVSGAPFSVQDGTDQELTGINHQRPDVVDPNNVYTGQTCGGCFYLNKSAFSPQALGTVGNLGWNSVNTPAYWDIDLALSRRFAIREKQNIEVRADAFNIGNNYVPAFPGTTPAQQSGTGSPISPAVPAFAAVNNGQFAQILAAFPTRKIQFAVKYTF
jgi:Carboxypeptidase regulatory-like domain